ncbi:MAG: protein-tyrosine-phosphatase [Eubacterium sp.]|nr:protein-tyrosine-phosphatase [Eubacterium sp.]
MLFREKRSGKMTDMHCHILPAVDDGSRSMEQTMDMLRIAQGEGITAMIVTPHYKEGRHNASPATIMERIGKVQEEAERQGIFIPLYPGNEVFYFDGLPERLENNEVLSLNHTDRVLVEFSPTEDHTYIRNALDSVRAVGYVPILAHVERYGCMVRDWKRVRELKQMDAEIQINAASAVGQLGKQIQRFIHDILQENLVDYVGTDAHDARGRAPQFQKCYQALVKRYGESYMDEIFHENASTIINAE